MIVRTSCPPLYFCFNILCGYVSLIGADPDTLLYYHYDTPIYMFLLYSLIGWKNSLFS